MRCRGPKSSRQPCCDVRPNFSCSLLCSLVERAACMQSIYQDAEADAFAVATQGMQGPQKVSMVCSVSASLHGRTVGSRQGGLGASTCGPLKTSASQSELRVRTRTALFGLEDRDLATQAQWGVQGLVSPRSTSTFYSAVLALSQHQDKPRLWAACKGSGASGCADHRPAAGLGGGLRAARHSHRLERLQRPGTTSEIQVPSQLHAHPPVLPEAELVHDIQ